MGNASAMTVLKGFLYPSGNIDFPREHNAWAFQRMQDMRSEQEKRVVVHPEVAPLDLSRAHGVEKEKTAWLESLQDVLNGYPSVNLLSRPEALRLRKGFHEIDSNTMLITLVSQEAFDELCGHHWGRIAHFYATRHDGFRFDITTMLSLKDRETQRPHVIELASRVVEGTGGKPATLTFDATGSTAHVKIVDWRGTVAEGSSGRFGQDDTQVKFHLPRVRVPLTFLYEYRPQFGNHAYYFSGERFDSEMKRLQKRRKAPQK